MKFTDLKTFNYVNTFAYTANQYIDGTKFYEHIYKKFVIILVIPTQSEYIPLYRSLYTLVYSMFTISLT